MGYQSDVQAVFYTMNKEQYPMLKLFVDENFPEQLKEYLERIKSNRYFGFVFFEESVKWYEDSPDVMEFNEFVSKFQEVSPEYEEAKKQIDVGVVKRKYWCHEFIRVGENYDDIETNRSWDADGIMYVNRSIHMDL